MNSGTLPLKKFDCSIKFSNFGSKPRFAGIVPVKRFARTSSTTSSDKRIREIGKVPESWLYPKLTLEAFELFPIALGKDQEIVLFETLIVVRLFIVQRVSGRVPVS